MSHEQHPRSAPPTGELPSQETQNREGELLSVNRRSTRGGQTPSASRHEPTDSSSGSSPNDLLRLPQTNTTADTSLENGTNVNSESASAAPSSSLSADSDPWKRKVLLTLGKRTGVVPIEELWDL